MEEIVLSKSLYIKGLKCQKLLWLNKHNKAVLTPPNADTKARFDQGNTVGDLACSLFPDGREIPFDGTTFNQKIALTHEWLDKGVDTIFEAAFEYGGVLVMVDILRKSSDNTYEIYEVKSSSWNKSKKLKDFDKYLPDVAIQYWVLRGLGLNITKASLTLLNGDYVREKELEIEKLFIHKDMTHEVLALQADIPATLNKFKAMLTDKNEPNIEIGVHCKKPYDCSALDYCWRQQRNIPDYSVFNIFPIGGGSKAIKLYQEGVIAVENIPDDMIFLTENQQSKVDRWKAQNGVINKDAIKDFVGSISYPIYHFDFETMGPAIPEFKGIKPYGKYPFQYSLHIEQEDGSLEHKEYLATPGQDPREEIAKRMVEDIPKDACIMAFNTSFEKSIVRTLADNYPVYADHLMGIHSNFIDLALPFQKGYYWDPEMQGHYGLKYVLPAIVPEMKDAYPDLDGVHNGGDAMRMFAELGRATDPHEIIKIKTALLEYCKLDTYAMVMILRSLRKLVDTPTNS
jgi:hypothetical protein